MLTDVLTQSFTQHMTHPPYAYSYMLIPCLLIDYKAPIVLLQSLLPSLLSVFEILCFPHVYKASGAQRSPVESPPR